LKLSITVVVVEVDVEVEVEVKVIEDGILVEDELKVEAEIAATVDLSVNAGVLDVTEVAVDVKDIEVVVVDNLSILGVVEMSTCPRTVSADGFVIPFSAVLLGAIAIIVVSSGVRLVYD